MTRKKKEFFDLGYVYKNTEKKDFVSFFIVIKFMVKVVLI